MSRKDEQYEERRKIISLFCSQVNNTLSKEVTFNRLLFNKDAGIMGSWALESTDGYLLAIHS